MTYSASSLKLYKDCPFAFKCRYIDKIETEFKQEFLQFGLDFHANIKELNTDDEKIIKMVKSIKKLIDRHDIKEFEKKYFKEIDGEKFFSIIDAECDKGILEFKSSSSKWYKRDLENNFIQATLYQKITGKPLIYYVVNKKTFETQEIPYLYNEENWNKILEIVNQIKNDKEFKYSGSYFQCKYCDYKNICPKYKPVDKSKNIKKHQ